jgi:histidinol phosphatase-like PHP family hydrolase
MTARPTNARLSELLVARAEAEEGHRRRALERAGRSAMFVWTEEAAALTEAGFPLTDLPTVGPWVAEILTAWLEHPDVMEREAPEPAVLRQGFLSRSDVDRAVRERPDLRSGLRGDLQSHTTYTDGKDELRAMADEAALLGHSYLAVTDHSKTLPIAHGMDEEGFRTQAGELEEVRHDPVLAASGFRVLHGIEMNVTPEGLGDMEPELLASLDLVLGTFHSHLRVKEDQTDRYLAALRLGGMDVLAHPRCRMFGRRAGLTADWDRVFAQAVTQRVALEVDCHPYRQDLDVELARKAVEHGAWISIGTDAHSTGELRNIDYGLATVALADVPTDRILNFLPLDELLAWVGNRRPRAHAG